MLRFGMRFVDRGAEFYVAQHRRRQVDSLKQKAANFGMKIIDVTTAQESLEILSRNVPLFTPLEVSPFFCFGVV
jgi:hypothetical protein